MVIWLVLLTVAVRPDGTAGGSGNPLFVVAETFALKSLVLALLRARTA
jgi:hypothetical protein